MQVKDKSNLRRNRPLIAAWIITPVSLLTNGFFFWQFAGEWLLPWLVLVLCLVSLALCVVSLRLAFGRPRLYRGRISGSIVTVIACATLAITLLINHMARGIPDAAEAPHAGQKAPDFSLADTAGSQVSLSELLNTPIAGSPEPEGKPKAVLLVFYRGYW